jgi:integrase
MSQQHLNAPDQPVNGRASLKIDRWPCDDRARWQRAKTPTGRFDRDAVLHGLAAPTVRGLEQTLGRFLAYIIHVACLTPDKSLGSVLTPELMDAYAGFMRQRLRAGSVHEELRRLRTAVGILLPGRDLGWISGLPAAPSNAEVIASRKPIVRPDVARVLDKAYRAFDRIATSRPDTISCQFARNCLIVAFCALFELRLADLSRIRLGEHLNRAGTRWRLMFLDDVKNDTFLLFEVPRELAERLDIYLATFRVELLRENPDHGFLWVGRSGKPILTAAVAAGVDKFGRAHLDRALNSHVFRHAFAVTTVVRNPADADLASAGLGHTSSQMVHGCYTQSGQEEISRLWLRKLAQRRKGR